MGCLYVQQQCRYLLRGTWIDSICTIVHIVECTYGHEAHVYLIFSVLPAKMTATLTSFARNGIQLLYALQSEASVDHKYAEFGYMVLIRAPNTSD